MTHDHTTTQSQSIDLSRFIGTTSYYRYSRIFPWLLLTDGTMYLGEAAKAFWLFDVIADNMQRPIIKLHHELQTLQFWRLRLTTNQMGVLSCEWDRDEVIFEEEIDCIDFPLSEVRIFVQRYREVEGRWLWVAHLPSEY